MLALVVEFGIKPAHVDAFDRAIVENARLSRETEPGCRHFDVCRDSADPTLFFLYELYDDDAAIEAHLRSPHYQAMNAATTDWVASKTVRKFVRAAGGAPARHPLARELVFDHVKFGATDFAASKAFFVRALEPLGVVVIAEGAPAYGVELCTPKGNSSLCIFQTDEKPARLHVAFTAEHRGQVDAFHHAALEAGGEDNGAPGLRPQYHANYYAAFVIGPDGHNIEVVCHRAEA